MPGRLGGVLRSLLVLGVLLPLLAQEPIVVQGLTVQQLSVVQIQPLPVYVIALDLMYFLLQLLHSKYLPVNVSQKKIKKILEDGPKTLATRGNTCLHHESGRLQRSRKDSSDKYKLQTSDMHVNEKS